MTVALALALKSVAPTRPTLAVDHDRAFVAIGVVVVRESGGRRYRRQQRIKAPEEFVTPFVLSLAQGGAPGMSPSAVATAVLIAASANNLAKAAYAIGFGDLAAAKRPAILLGALALLGFAAAAAYLV
jgi:hypothetical protein